VSAAARASRLTPGGAALLAALLGALAMAAPIAAAERAPTPSVSHAAFDSLLADCVRDGVVDYPRLCSGWRAGLDAYLDRLARVDDTALARNGRLAFLFDLYDATMLRAVCERAGAGWTPAAAGYAVFKAPLVRMRGGAISLDSLEHGLIRPFARDPRVHVALVCGARSCPPLPSRAWQAADLDSMLDERMHRFVNDPARNRADARARTLHLSPIFRWYAADFGGEAAAPAYVGRVLGRDTRGWTVEWLDYDWSLNGPPPR
jgi:hypothetical protein